ncbi:Serine/threonine-protein phosphatase [Phytophthora nicotianae]|uniref:Serine/threonine-protein phosphatase n=1 Tax=Phytophthora nicotianae TaxID=4792 RepID=A0A0W8D6Q7_PHYNI|nr:Serine/threonine-protein phosphatase [Phytophthora nicotianae]
MSDYSLIISGDCGGTNTRLSLWKIPNGATQLKGNIAPGDAIFAKKYLNEDHASFNEVCHLFMNEAKLTDHVPEACVLACAGPILNNTVDFTNVEFGWKIDGASLEKELGIKQVKLINDFAAMGYGLLTLRPHEYIVLNDAPKDETAPMATIGAGTGLGECFLTPGNDGQYSCFACEGGHTDFAPADEIEIELYNEIKTKLGCSQRFSVERIVSGPGLATIYEFLAKKFPEKVDPKVHEQFLTANTQQGKVIGENAKTNELCNQTLEIFVGAYGREAGNAMLKYLPRGGFYITGGLAPRTWTTSLRRTFSSSLCSTRVVFTNIKHGWKIDGPGLEKELGITTVKLINDFAAMGYGLLTLKPHEYIVLNEAEKEEGMPIATIGAGTGLGECYLTADKDGNYSRTHRQWPGLANIYRFLAKKFPDKVDKKVHEAFVRAKALQGKIVGDNAKTNELCNQAMEIFVDAYGREAGCAMLKYLPRGGFYITGGLAPKNLDYFTQKDIFLKACFNKGRVSPALKAIPIYLVLTEDLGERGAHYYAYQLLQTYNNSLLGNIIQRERVQRKFATMDHLALYSTIGAVGVAAGVVLGNLLRK